MRGIFAVLHIVAPAAKVPLTTRHKCLMVRDMDLRAQLVTVADAFATQTGRSRARVSTLAFNQGNRLDDYAAGRLSPGVRSFERAMMWFSENWPEGGAWPNDVPRPERLAA